MRRIKTTRSLQWTAGALACATFAAFVVANETPLCFKIVFRSMGCSEFPAIIPGGYCDLGNVTNLPVFTREETTGPGNNYPPSTLERVCRNEIGIMDDEGTCQPQSPKLYSLGGLAHHWPTSPVTADCNVSP